MCAAAALAAHVALLFGSAGASGAESPGAVADSGAQASPLKTMEFEGLRRTRREVVEREISLRPGDIADAESLERDRLRLLDLDIFAEVTLQIRQDDSTGQTVLHVTVSERPTLLAYPVVNYDPDDGITWGGFASSMNLRGLNQSAGAMILGGERRGASAWFSTPWTAGRRLATGMHAYVQRRRLNTEKLIETSYGLSGSLEPLQAREAGLPIFAGWERVRTRDSRQPADSLALMAAGYAEHETEDDHRWAGIGFTRDTRDYRARPRRGWRIGAGATQHGGFLGGDTSMQRYSLDMLLVLSTGRESAFTAATRAVWSRGAVPRYLRLNMGGGNTLRGHSQGEYGGESRLVGWVEQRFPLLPKRTYSIWKDRYTLDFTVDWSVYADAGAVWDGDDLQEGKAAGRFGGGVGLRIVAPLVRLIRLDVATDGSRVRAYALGGVRL